MALTRPPVLPVWADSGDKTQPADAEILTGWPASAVPPSRQRFNWFQNFVANGIRYFARRGLSDYAATETYEIGDRCIGDDGKTYKSLVAANINFAPSTSPTKWERWGFSLAELYAFLLSNHGGNCPATGPAAAPSAGAPWTRYTSVTPYFEEWEWFPNGWRVVANPYATSVFLNGPYSAVLGGSPVTSFTAPRAGRLTVYGAAMFLKGSAVTVYAGVGLNKNGVNVILQSSNLDSVTQGIYISNSTEYRVSAGDVISVTSDATVGGVVGSYSWDITFGY